MERQDDAAKAALPVVAGNNEDRECHVATYLNPFNLLPGWKDTREQELINAKAAAEMAAFLDADVLQVRTQLPRCFSLRPSLQGILEGQQP